MTRRTFQGSATAARAKAGTIRSVGERYQRNPMADLVQQLG